MDPLLRETYLRELMMTSSLLGDQPSLIASSLLTRDRWIRPGDEFNRYIGNVRWKLGGSEGIYDVAVSCIPLFPVIRSQNICNMDSSSRMTGYGKP